MRLFLISLIVFLIISSLNTNVLSQGKMLGRFTKPLFPSLLLKEDSKYEEVKNKVIKRFNLPSAQITQLPSSFGLQEYYSLNMYNPSERLEEELVTNEHERLMFIAICSLRYLGKTSSIYLTTSLLPPPSRENITFLPLENVQSTDGATSVKKVVFPSGIVAMMFINTSMKDGQNQLVFIKDRYYISIASNLSEEEIIKIASENLVIR